MIFLLWVQENLCQVKDNTLLTLIYIYYIWLLLFLFSETTALQHTKNNIKKEDKEEIGQWKQTEA